MKIIIDTQEKKYNHVTRVFDEKGIEWERRKLNYCDYSFEIDGKSYEKECSIERKATLSELSGNFTKGRDRFKREFERGQEDGCKMVLLIEQKDVPSRIKQRIAMDKAGVNVKYKISKTWRSGFTGKSMAGSLKAFKERYDLDLIFCHKLAAAGEILKVFEEYLENEK